MKKVIFTAVLLCIGSAAFLQTGKPANFDAGKKIYNQVCLSCHQADGNGVPGLNPPLTKSEWVSGDKKRLINIILKGLNEPVTVNGEEYANPMPAQPMLTDQQIADVLTFVRNSFGNKATPVTAAEVKAQRNAKK